MERWIKPAFSVIGLEGRCPAEDGGNAVQRLWDEANRRFTEVAPLAKIGENGLVGVWGAMTDEGRRFRPWEDGFTRGLYLAGVECRYDAQPPEGWTRWDVPGFEFLRVKNDGPDVFLKTLAEMEKSGLQLVGAVQDFTDPATGQGYMCFPVRKLKEPCE